MYCSTYHFDNNTKLHQNSVDYDQKNIHCAVDRNTLIFDQDHLIEYLETDLGFSTVSQTLNH